MRDGPHEWKTVALGFTVDRDSPMTEALEQRMKDSFTQMLYGDTGKGHEMTEAQKAREPGYYWVKFQGEWNIEEWRHGEWLITGSEETTREDVGEIGPRVEPPE